MWYWVTLCFYDSWSCKYYNNWSQQSYCNGLGGFHCLSCHGVKIKGIIWDRCGSKNKSDFANPVIKIDKSSAIAIQHCRFQHSIGQAILLIEISGDVIIDHCMFVNNTKYSGNGTVIYSISESSGSSTTKLFLSNSDFKGNQGANIIIYVNSLF